MKTATHYLLLLSLIVGMITPRTVIAKEKEGSKIYAGYIILKTGEKIYGNIEMLSPTLNEVKVKLLHIDKSEKFYKAEDLKQYAFEIKEWDSTLKKYNEKWVLYVTRRVERAPIPFGKKIVFLERKVSGAINFYNYYYQSNTDIDEPLKLVMYVEKQGAEDMLLEINRENYKDLLRKMTENDVELTEKIGTPSYGFKNIEDIVRAYNDYMITSGEENVLSSIDD